MSRARELGSILTILQNSRCGLDALNENAFGGLWLGPCYDRTQQVRRVEAATQNKIRSLASFSNP